MYFSTHRVIIVLVYCLVLASVIGLADSCFAQGLFGNTRERIFYAPRGCASDTGFLNTTNKGSVECLVVADSLWGAVSANLREATALKTLYHLEPSGDSRDYLLPDSVHTLVLWSTTSSIKTITVKGNGIQEIEVNGPVSSLKNIRVAPKSPVKKLLLKGLASPIKNVRIRCDSLQSLVFENCILPALSVAKTRAPVRKIQVSKSSIYSARLRALRRYKCLRELTLRYDSLKNGDVKVDPRLHLHTLVFTGNLLSELPTNLERLDSLETLILAENKFVNLPDHIIFPKRLKSISLYKNELSEVPNCLKSISNLQTLDLYYNKITTVPDFLCQMDSLNILYLAHNQINQVPEAMGRMQQLSELYLHHNRLTSVPDTLASLANLRVLHLNHNYLSTFPSLVLRLLTLEDLDLSNNMIEYFPDELASLPYLTILALQNNAFSEEEIEKGALGQLIDLLQKRGIRVLH